MHLIVLSVALMAASASAGDLFAVSEFASGEKPPVCTAANIARCRKLDVAWEHLGDKEITIAGHNYERVHSRDDAEKDERLIGYERVGGSAGHTWDVKLVQSPIGSRRVSGSYTDPDDEAAEHIIASYRDDEVALIEFE